MATAQNVSVDVDSNEVHSDSLTVRDDVIVELDGITTELSRASDGT